MRKQYVLTEQEVRSACAEFVSRLDGTGLTWKVLLGVQKGDRPGEGDIVVATVIQDERYPPCAPDPRGHE